MLKIALLGFGEAAQAFVAGWETEAAMSASMTFSAYDIKYADAAHKAGLIAACDRLKVSCAGTQKEALSGRQAVFSLVTADQALAAARSAASSIEPGAFYFDCNSCAPSTKNAAAEQIDGAGGYYVDVAVMSPVHPKRHRTPLLIAGEMTDEALAFLSGLGMNARIAGSKVGQASAIKMLRSVMIKGLEALTAECMLAARRAGVEDAVLASLQASDPGFDWTARSAYNLERMMVHGARRASEMEEVARTLRDLGLPDRMTIAAAEWQRQIAGLALAGGESALGARADRILGRIAP